MMLKIKKILMVFIAAICLSSAISVAAPGLNTGLVCAEAAAKKGLVKEKGKYYFYENGKKVSNCWKTITVEGKKVRYYFGKKGAAYAADYDEDHPKAILVKKIDGVRYGFLSTGACVKGTYCDEYCDIYVFKSNYKCNEERTAILQKYGAFGKKPTRILKELGTASKVKKSNSCYDQGTDYTYFYKNFKFVVFESSVTGKKICMGYTPR